MRIKTCLGKLYKIFFNFASINLVRSTPSDGRMRIRIRTNNNGSDFGRPKSNGSGSASRRDSFFSSSLAFNYSLFLKKTIWVQGNNAEEQTFLKLVEGSEWLALLQSVMQLAGAVTDLIDLQGSSVMLCLEDGWDLTCQVSSLAQLSLDPFYRTIQVWPIHKGNIFCRRKDALMLVFLT